MRIKAFAITVFTLLLLTTGAYAQFDNMFYYPDKEWVGINDLKYDDIYLSGGGDTVHTVFFRPEGAPKATVVYFHGNAANVSKLTGLIKPLTGNGYQVAAMDYRGYGHSGGSPTHVNIAEDARRLFAYLTEKEDIARMPVIIYGQSIGAQVAVLIAAENKYIVRGVVLDGAAKSFVDLALTFSPEENHNAIKQYFQQPYSAYGSIDELDGVKLLMIHSEQDIIPIAGARELYEKASGPKRFWVYEGPHIQAPLLYPDEYIEQVGWLTDEK